ncbi:hypothetical protein WJX81_001139 [Elliptochloris bilobata]|uniref:RING-type E3 ubiquitin transferase n=1 Tax=Elliptochloris bilobata TaxID=381761 RepID=A0AAW1S401_9CHLO
MGTSQAEDAALRRVFAVTLSEGQETEGIVYLGGLSQELLTERGAGVPVLLSKDNLERVLMARLMEPSIGEQWPVFYLIMCYARASDEFRAASRLRDASAVAAVQAALLIGKQLAVSYTGLLLTMDLFIQPPAALARGALQILDSLDAREGRGTPGAPPLPPQFLEDLAANLESEDRLDAVAESILWVTSRRLVGISPLGDYIAPLQLHLLLFGVRQLARAAGRSARWLPGGARPGRSIQTDSMLGPAFSLSPLPDGLSRPLPDVMAQCFAGCDARLQTELRTTHDALRATMGQIHDTLHRLAMTLLRTPDTREDMLRWLAHAIEANVERSKSMGDPARSASHGFFINLNAVLLRLCDPFLEPMSGKAWGKLDARYVMHKGRLSFEEDAKLAADFDEQRRLLAKHAASGSTAGLPSYHFICECFFLTAKGLHLGLVKLLGDWRMLLMRVSHTQGWLQEIEGLLGSGSAPPQQARLMQRQRDAVKLQLRTMLDTVAAFHTHVLDEALLRSAMAFYRLMAVWLLRLSSPSAAAGADPGLPLPTPPPEDMRFLPEYFVEDLLEVQQHITEHTPAVLEGARMEEVLMFLVVFLNSPQHVRNPYLRGKMVELLQLWMPNPEEEKTLGGRRRRRQQPVAASLSLLIEAHPLVLQHLVRNVLQLYVDVEHTGRDASFIEKFEQRERMGELLTYLWNVPAHRTAWRAVAAKEGSADQLYHRFCHHLDTDCIYQLNSVLGILPEIQELEAVIDDEASFAALPEEEQTAKQQELQKKPHGCLTLIRLSTTEITGPWLTQEMAPRIASTLNYFLLHLTGPERRKLKIKDPERYGWQPKTVLAQIAAIYVNLAHGDASGRLAAAVAADSRSYRDEMFTEAAQVLRSFGLLPENAVEELEELGLRVSAAVAAIEQEDDLYADAPDDFVDQLTGAVMEDPITLPKSGVTLDRASIMRHLLSSQTDPFSREPLRAEELLPNPALKERILAWKRASTSNGGSEGRPLDAPGERSSEPQREQPKLVRIRLSVEYRVHSRQLLCIGGSQIPFGWSFLSIARVPMVWTDGDIWTSEVDLPINSRIEYKYVILEEQDWTKQESEDAEGVVTFTYRTQPDSPPDVQTIQKQMAIVAWQPGPNKVVQVPSEDEVPPPPEDDLAGTWERLLLDESGEPLLERRDVWGFAEDDVNAPRNRGLRYG